MSLKNNLFLILYFFFLLLVIPILVIFNKAEIHLWINGFHNNAFDIIFKYMTHIGDGFFSAAIALIFLFIRYRYAIIVIVSYSISGLLVQLLKQTIFSDIARPSRYFDGIYKLHLVEGVKMWGKNSFPSGHSASAFALFLSLALFTKNKSLQILLFIIALTVAFSRVYLSQHFLIDITAGSFLGICISLLCFWYFQKIDNKWIDRSIVIRKR